jgi:hypothetical protein
MKLIQENVQWYVLVVAVLNIWAVLPENYFNVTNFVSPYGSLEF